MLGSIKGSEVFINRTPRTQLYGPHWKAYKDAEAAAAAAGGMPPPATPPPANPPAGATSGAAGATLARETGDEYDQQ